MTTGEDEDEEDVEDAENISGEQDKSVHDGSDLSADNGDSDYNEEDSKKTKKKSPKKNAEEEEMDSS